MNNFKKDILLTVIIGEIASWLIVFISQNLFFAPYLKYLPIIFPLACVLGLIVAYFLGKIAPVVYQLAKFVLVGGLNFLIDISVLSFFVFTTGVVSGLMQSGFKGISFLVAVINSYFWNKHWTFKKTNNKKSSKEFLQFFVVSIIGLTINIIVDYFFVNNIPPFKGVDPTTWTQLGAVISAATALTWNFIGYKFIVFDSKDGS
ncbi:MAG: hypothetical protein Athens071424_200 [Parcubacteria group bacterium Athens0714_24]|nr:MAG: hypothetical protein Athens071424_200 [Parcubacteria group bacterium Athens0714_24]